MKRIMKVREEKVGKSTTGEVMIGIGMIKMVKTDNGDKEDIMVAVKSLLL